NVAIEQGDEGAVRDVLAHGIDIHAVDRNGNTPLSLAARADEPRLCQMFIDYGADVNLSISRSDYGLTSVASHADYRTLELLLQHGADPNRRSCRAGVPPLQSA